MTPPAGDEGVGGSIIPDFAVAISSVKFSGDMQWSYSRNMRAAIDAAAKAGVYFTFSLHHNLSVLYLVTSRARFRFRRPYDCSARGLCNAASYFSSFSNDLL
jgi:hypothetical protein